MSLERFRFQISGVTPILMNCPLNMKRPGSDAAAKVRKIPGPDEEAASLLYRNADGTVYGPAGFKSAIATAAKGMKFGKLGAPGVIKGSVFVPIDSERIQLFNPRTKKPLTDKDYTVDSRRAVIPSSGAGIVKSRPRFEEWCCIAELDIETDFITPDAVLGLLKKAGQTVGYLDYRPECGGSFGRFVAVLIDDHHENGKAIGSRIPKTKREAVAS